MIDTRREHNLGVLAGKSDARKVIKQIKEQELRKKIKTTVADASAI